MFKPNEEIVLKVTVEIDVPVTILPDEVAYTPYEIADIHKSWLKERIQDSTEGTVTKIVVAPVK